MYRHLMFVAVLLATAASAAAQGTPPAIPRAADAAFFAGDWARKAALR